MTKKGFIVPVGLAVAALLITAVPFFIYRERFFDLPWWPAVVAMSSGLAVLAIIADICYAPAPRGYRVYWDQRQLGPETDEDQLRQHVPGCSEKDIH